MNKTKLFYSFLTAILFLAAGIGANAQTTTVKGNYPNGDYPSIVITDTPGDSCNGAGLEQHDGPVHGNGYTAFTDSVRMVIKFHPPSYPWNYTNVCCAFTRTASGPTTMLYDIIVYDTLGAGGTPGAILAVIPGNTVSGIAIYPSYTWNSTTVAIPVSATLGAVYIGYRYKNGTTQAFYCTVDEQAATTLWPGYYATNVSFPAVWQTIQSVAGFAAYKCMAIRTQGSSAISPLCEQFAGTTFAPAGWTITGAGASFWSRVTQSGFGVGVGSAKYDMWNASNGINAELTTLTFSPTNPAGVDTLYMTEAFQPFGAPDSLIISTSTNGGTTWTSLVRLGNSQLGTTTGAPSPFVPSATQWAKRKYVLPGNVNKLQFQGKSGFGDNLYIDSLCIRYIPVGIGNNNNQIPQVYTLAQNYPNPFNPSTVISFGLPKAGNVSVVVYDLLGKEVRTLVNEFQTAGTHSITFDASSLASGVYFYSIKANDFTQTKKMLLIK